MTKQEALDIFCEEFKVLLAQGGKDPKSECYFADERGDNGKLPCFMLDTTINVLCRVGRLIAEIE